jgi:hypothetical protein
MEKKKQCPGLPSDQYRFSSASEELWEEMASTGDAKVVNARTAVEERRF